MSKKTEKEQKEREEQIQEEIRRVKMPKGNQVMGMIDSRLGGSRLRVKCLDGNTRVCSVPGRLKRKLWLREGNIVLVEPWEYGGDEKGNIIFKYKPTQVSFLRKKGYLNKLDEFDEF